MGSAGPPTPLPVPLLFVVLRVTKMFEGLFPTRVTFGTLVMISCSIFPLVLVGREPILAFRYVSTKLHSGENREEGERPRGKGGVRGGEREEREGREGRKERGEGKGREGEVKKKKGKILSLKKLLLTPEA